jgi:hypothetical protein
MICLEVNKFRCKHTKLTERKRKCYRPVSPIARKAFETSFPYSGFFPVLPGDNQGEFTRV